jgi:hypothetical protein
VVGGDRLKLGNGVVAVGSNGFDVYSDGATEWNNYDEATFVYEQITGDFDKKVRVEYQDTSSQWARAGLIMREVTNIGVTDTVQLGSQSEGNSGVAPFDGKATRYQKVHVNPVQCLSSADASLAAGNNSWEGNRRMLTGGPCSSALAINNSNPQYPNAWCRLKRVGQTFAIYRSDDGVNWVDMGTTTYPDITDTVANGNPGKPMPDTVYVGIDYSPENGNIFDTGSSRGMWLAKFRDYGDTFAATGGTPTLALARAANGVTLTFTGTLQAADSILGPWTDVTGGSPQTVTAAGGAKFYRAKQ